MLLCTAVLLLWAPLFSYAIPYISSFVACTYSAPLGSVYVYPGSAGNSATCASDCAQAGYLYSYWNSDTVNGGCKCTNASPTGGQLAAATTANQCSFPSQSEIRVTQTTWAWTSCAGDGNGAAYGTDYFGGGSGSTIESCLQSCKSYPVLQMYPTYDEIFDEYFYTCYCGTSNWGPNGGEASQACGPRPAALWYTHPANAEVPGGSGYVKRAKVLKERLEMVRERELHAHCPAGLTACKTEGGDAFSFECVDTQSELESCGGCVLGEFASANSTASGVDCSASKGVALGGVTCALGQCQATSCKKGYSLVERACVKDI